MEEDMKPVLHILTTPRQSEFRAFVDSVPVHDAFEVTVGTEMNKNADLAFSQAYTAHSRVLKRLIDWGGPYVLQVGGDVWAELPESSMRVSKVLEALRLSATTVFVSRFLEDLYRRRIGDGPFTTLPGGLWGTDHCQRGVDPSRFRAKEEYAIVGKPKIVMAISLTAEHKWRGLPYFLDMCKEDLGGTDVICSGKERGQWDVVQRLRKRHPCFRFTWAGNKWPELLASADLFVHPSMFDGWPRAVAEAMCAGLPVLAFDVGGIAEVSETNINVSPFDQQTFRAALKHLLTNEELRRAHGLSRRAEAVERTEQHRGDYAKLLTRVLEGRRVA
jgi:glycosyltransferase involved in cell wall biosynthesis